MSDSSTKLFLFIGGPYDGNRIMVDDGKPKILILDEQCREHIYDKVLLQSEGRVSTIYVCDSFDSSRIIESLIDSYGK